MYRVVKPNALIPNRGEKTDKKRGWPQGCPKGGDIWPGGAGGGHATMH